jgi:hypothetical protein
MKVAATFQPREPLRFVGESNAGERLTNVGTISSDDFLPKSSDQGFYDMLRAAGLRVERGSTGSVREYRFGLTNAALCGSNASAASPTGRSRLPRAFL